MFSKLILFDILEHAYLKPSLGALMVVRWHLLSLFFSEKYVIFMEAYAESSGYVFLNFQDSASMSMISVFTLMLFFLFRTVYGFNAKVYGYHNINEWIIEWFNSQIMSSVPFKTASFFCFFFLTFLFIWFSNSLGLFPLCETVTVFLMINLFFSLTIQISMTLVGLHFHGCEFMKLFLPGGIPTVVGLILLPVEVLSYMSSIVSLAVRLFANMVAGHCVLQMINIILLGTIYGFYFGAVFFASMALIIFFVMSFLEFSVAFLQAYVFLTLAIIYMESTLNMH